MTAIHDRPQPGDLLTLAFETINARGTEYDNTSDLDQNFREAAAVASIVVGKVLSPRDIAMVMVCVKLIRSKSSPDKIDSYVDAMNYIAFSACFAGLAPLPNIVMPRPTGPAPSAPPPAPSPEAVRQAASGGNGEFLR